MDFENVVQRWFPWDDLMKPEYYDLKGHLEKCKKFTQLTVVIDTKNNFSWKNKQILSQVTTINAYLHQISYADEKIFDTISLMYFAIPIVFGTELWKRLISSRLQSELFVRNCEFFFIINI